MKLVFVLNVCFAVLLLTEGCNVGPVEQAGGDDFPNMIAEAGKRITESLDQKWVNPAEASSVPVNTIDVAGVSFGVIERALGKKAASQEKGGCSDSVWLSIDLSSRRISVYSRKCNDTLIKNDTLVITVNEKDTAIVYLAGSQIQTIEPYSALMFNCKDIDGDSFIYKAGAQQQKTRIFLARSYPGGRVETIDIGYDGGADGNLFTGDDNMMMFVSAAVLFGNDTISFVGIDDADGDGYIRKTKEDNDSGIVDIIVRRGKDDNDLFTISSTTICRMVIFSHDSTKNYAIRYGIEKRFQTRIVGWNIETIHGDSTFYPGDTVNIFRCTKPLYGDSLESDTLVVRALLGNLPADSADDAIIGIYLHSSFREGDEREFILDYSAGTPVGARTRPRNGILFAKMVNRSGDWIEVNGKIEEEVISAEVTTSGGKRYAVVWNAGEGKVLSVTPL